MVVFKRPLFNYNIVKKISQPQFLLCDKGRSNNSTELLSYSFFVGVRVKLMVNVAEALVSYVGIDLCGGNIAVA